MVHNNKYNISPSFVVQQIYWLNLEVELEDSIFECVLI